MNERAKFEVKFDTLWYCEVQHSFVHVAPKPFEKSITFKVGNGLPKGTPKMACARKFASIYATRDVRKLDFAPFSYFLCMISN